MPKSIGFSFRKSIVFDVLLLYYSALPTIASYRQFFLSDSTSRVRYSSGYTCQYERGKEPKRSGTSLSLAHARLVHSAKAPLDLTAPLPISQVLSLVAPSFLTHTPTPSGCWLNSNNHLNIVYSVNAGTLNATRPQVSTYISGQWRFFEESMLEQLHRYTHEIISALSVRKMF